MPRRQELTINKRTADSLRVGDRDAVFWDRALPGFGLRVYPSGLKNYIVQSRGPGGSKRVTLGSHGKITPDAARAQAAKAIDRIKRGEEPIPPPPVPDPTMADLAERFMRECVVSRCAQTTVESYRCSLDRHVLPAFGNMPVREVGRKEVTELHYAMRHQPCAANDAIKIMARLLSLAMESGLREHGTNPCKAVKKYRTSPRERFLTDAEYRTLGRTVAEMEGKGKLSSPAAAAIRLLVLTGCRRNEVLELQWNDIDRTAGELRIREGKTGGRMVPLTTEVQKVLDGIPRVTGNPWVIPGAKPGSHLKNISLPWLAVRAEAKLDGVRLHDLRHSWASRALALGESLSMIGKLLGHNRIETTARYAHLAQDAERLSADRVGGSIGVDILPDQVQV